MYQEALAIFRELKLDRDIAIQLNDLAILERRRKRYDAAEQYCREALALAEKTKDKEGQASCTASLGHVALARERWTDAREWLEKALPLARDVARQNLIADLQCGLARVHEAEGRSDLALPLAEGALAIYERLRHKDLADARELVERLKSKIGKQ